MHKNGKISLKEQIYTQVMNDIIAGVYKPSEILNEKQLVEKYGVSKSPVRDALIELCKEGVLYSHPRYGYEIVTVNEKEVEDIINFRLMLEPQCLRQAIHWMDKKDIDELKAFTHQNCRVEGEISIWQHWENNKLFHLKLNSYCRNAYCYKTMENSLSVLTRAYAQNYWDRWRTTYFNLDCEGHLEIIRLMEEGRVEESVQQLKRDIQSFQEVLQRC